MSLIIDADGEYLTGVGGSFAAASATQATMAICVKRDSSSSTYQSYCAVSQDITDSYDSIGLAHNGASVDCFVIPSGAETRVDPSVSTGTTAWQWLILTFEKDVANKVYSALVGGSVNSGTGPVSTSAFNNAIDQIRIGFGSLRQAGWFCRAKLSHCAFWNTTLSPAQITDLVSGGAGGISKNPQAIANSNLTFYAPLTSDATVTVGGISLSATGTLTYDGADNPNVEAYGGGSVDGTATGATLTGTSSLTAGSAAGTSAGTASGATLAGTSSITAGTATGGSGTGSFTTQAMENNSGAGLLVSTAVSWTWYEGTIGSAPTSTTHGAGTTNASGVLAAPGLPLAPGFILATDGVGVYYEAGTPA